LIPSRVLPPPPPTPLTSLPGSRSSRPQLVSTLKIPSDREDRAYLSRRLATRGAAAATATGAPWRFLWCCSSISCACMRYSLILRYKVRAQYPNHCRHGSERPAPPPGPSVDSRDQCQGPSPPRRCRREGREGEEEVPGGRRSVRMDRPRHARAGGEAARLPDPDRVRPGRARGDGGDGRLVRGREGGESGGGAFFLPKKVNVNKYRIR